jgi:uncharacterized repeat protein (TIGR01451 family)
MRPGPAAIAMLLVAALTGAFAAPAARADIVPFVDCVAPNPATGTWLVYFGYTNDGSQMSIPFGSENQVIPGFGFQGQPTVFNIGTYPRVFRAVFNQTVFNAIAWELNGHQAIAQRTPAMPAPDPVPLGGFCVAGSTGPAIDITPTSAKLGAIVGTVGESTSYNFEYGTGPGPLTTLPPAVAGPGQAALVTQSVSGLTPNTLYRYRVIATNSDGTTTGEEKTFTTPPAPVPSIDVSVAQSLTPGSITAPGAITATLVAKNLDATNTATGVQLTDLLPPGTGFHADGSSPGCSGGEVVTCAVGDLGPGQEATRVVVLVATTPGLRTNIVRVTAAQPDPFAANDVAVASADVAAPPVPPVPPVPPTPPAPPTPPTPPAPAFKITAKPSSSGAVITESRRCPGGIAAGLAIDGNRAGRATLTARSGSAVVASRSTAIGTGRTTVVLCLNAAGRKLVAEKGKRFSSLLAGARVSATAGTARSIADVQLRFRKR